MLAITHWKAGSQWIAQVLKECAPKRWVPQKIAMAQLLQDRWIPEGVYPGAYLTYEQFRSGLELNSHITDPRPFVILRDLRDTLISRYFSHKFSHPVLTQRIADHRRELLELEKEEGLLLLMRRNLPATVAIQMSWIEKSATLMHYEELLSDELQGFQKIVSASGLDVGTAQLESIVTRNSFEQISGRKAGQEDVQSHYRKGVAGDWRGHFSEQLKEEFKELYGDVLIKTGYETDLDW